jgi:hypothetical protein
MFKFSGIYVPPLNSRCSKCDTQKYHIENPQILGTTIENLVTTLDWCLGFALSWSQELQGFQHHTNLDKHNSPNKRDQFDTGTVTLTAWDLHGAEFLEEKEIWLLN